MKRYRKPWALLAAALILLPALIHAGPWEGKVVKVVDGDTIQVLNNGNPVEIRLASVDCPELDQPYGPEARDFTVKKTAGKAIKVWPAGIDPEGRTLAFVFADNVDLNKELLKAGLAWHFKGQTRNPELARLEFHARNRKAGLWSEPNPVPPWEWRQGKRSGKPKIEFNGSMSTTIEHKKK